MRPSEDCAAAAACARDTREQCISATDRSGNEHFDHLIKKLKKRILCQLTGDALFICIRAARCFKSGGDNIDPGKKWWGHVPPANYAYDDETRGEIDK